MYWKNLKKRYHYFKQPVEYIHATAIYPLKDYDKLYENQNNLTHKVWQDFKTKWKIDFEMKKDLKDIDTNKDIIAIWFFKDRGDKFKGTDIELNGKIIAYTANTFFITPGQNKFKINKRKKWTFNRPALQLDLNIEQWKDLLASV